MSLIHVLGLDETWSVAYNLGETQTCNNLFLLFLSRDPRKRVARGSLDAEYIHVYLVFCCVMEKLLVFYICEIYSGEM